MATALETGREESVEDGGCRLVVDETTRQNDDVGVIVLAGELCHVLVPCQSGAYTLVLVKRDSHTLTATANGDARIGFTTLDTFSQWMGEVRIVYALITVGTIILHRIAFFLQVLKYELLEWITCVVRCQTYCLDFHSRMF